jgi:hypothetical protein
MITAKFYSAYLFTFSRFANLFSASMNSRFIQTGGEDRIVIFTTKFFFKNLAFLSPFIHHLSKEHRLFSKAGCKDNQGLRLSKCFSVKILPLSLKPSRNKPSGRNIFLDTALQINVSPPFCGARQLLSSSG